MSLNAPGVRLARLDFEYGLARLVDQPKTSGAVHLHAGPAEGEQPPTGWPFCRTLNPATTAMPFRVSKTKTSSVAWGGGPWLVSANRCPVRLLKANPEMGIATNVESNMSPGAVHVVDHALVRASRVVRIRQDVVGQASLRDAGPGQRTDLAPRRSTRKKGSIS